MQMKTDVEIAQEAKIEPIKKIAEKLQIDEDNLELYGKYKAKIASSFEKRLFISSSVVILFLIIITPYFLVNICQYF